MKPQLLLPGKRPWRRNLDHEGDILVVPGEPVQPDTAVARGQAPAPPIVVEIGQAQPAVSEGQDVQAGEVVARRRKLIGSGEEVQSPIAGKVVLITPTQLLLQPPPLTVTLEAQLPGVISAVRPGWGVDVEGCIALLRGWRAFGSSLHGRLGDDVAIAVDPLTTASFHALLSQGVRAIVAGSWGEDAPLEVMPDGPALFYTEPLQGRPMAAPIAQALQASKGQLVALGLERLPILGFAADQHGDPQDFGPGSWVRTADGRSGRLVRVGDCPRFFASGLRGIPVEVDLGDRTENLPLDSLEWIA